MFVALGLTFPQVHLSFFFWGGGGGGGGGQASSLGERDRGGREGGRDRGKRKRGEEGGGRGMEGGDPYLNNTSQNLWKFHSSTLPPCFSSLTMRPPFYSQLRERSITVIFIHWFLPEFSSTLPTRSYLV